MNKIEHRWLELRHFDELATRDSIVHRLHPSVKLITALVFLVVVASFSKYELAGLIPMFFYPVFMISAGNIPPNMIIKRLLLAMPFVLFIGIFNPLLDKTTVMHIGGFAISGGIVSFISILTRFTLSVLAALILVATTGVDAICTALLGFKVPRVVVTQILFMYRYVHVLIEEVIKTTRAYSLRSPHNEGIQFKVWGSLAGLLLLRTMDRAQRIYQAMLCRGFDGEVRVVRRWELRIGDLIFLITWLIFFAVVRSINIPQWLGMILMGGYQ